MHYRFERTVKTPTPVNGAMFSACGKRLVLGGGASNGRGFVALFDGDVEAREQWTVRGLEERSGVDGGEHKGRSTSITGVTFDASRRHLVASGFRFPKMTGVTMVIAIEGDDGGALSPSLRLVVREVIDGPGVSLRDSGLWLDARGVVVRGSSFDASETLRLVSPEVPLDAVGLARHLASSRVVMAGGRAFTGLLAEGSGRRDPETPLVGLFLEAELTDRALRVLAPAPVPDGATLGAILAHPGGDRLVTGDSHGRVLGWSRRPTLFGEAWQVTERLASHRKGVTAACYLDDGETLVTTDWAGVVRVTQGGATLQSWQLEPRSLPRALAVHPVTGTLVVGTKYFIPDGTGWPYREGRAYVYRLKR